MHSLALGNLLSDNFDPACAELAQRLGERGLPLRFAPRADFAGLLDGTPPLAFACGLAYVCLHDARPGALTPLVAPLIDDPDVTDAPVYFCDLLLRRELAGAAGDDALADLRGLRFAYNETRSFSGYLAARHGLAAHGLDLDHFGALLHSGGHRQSLAMLAAGEADVAALDSHSLAVECGQRPELRARLRRVARFGPYPMPPLLADGDLPAASRAALREALCSLPIDAAHSPALVAGRVRGFAAVDDAYYAPIRAIAAELSPALGAADFLRPAA